MIGKYAAQTTINKVIDERGIRKPYTGWTKYHVDETYFETIDTEQKAYWLGFLYADGFVSGNHFGLSLCCSDEQHLQKFKQAIQFTGPIYYKEACETAMIKGRIVHSSRQGAVKVARLKMCSDLIKLGCVKCKTFVITFPTPKQVPTHLLHHFLRGNFDGDGTISSCPRGKRRRYTTNFLGTEHFLTGVRNFLTSRGLNNVLVKYHGNIRKISYQGYFQVGKLEDVLYKDATIWLDRKRQHFASCRSQPVAKQGYPKSFLFIDPNGHKIVIHNLLKFCREHQLSAGSMYRVVRGQRNSNRGYRFVKHINASQEKASDER